jgi:transposase
LKQKKGGELVGYDGYHKKKGSKLHAVVTPASLPISITISPGNEHESRRLMPLMENISIKTPNQKGRPRKRPRRIHADKNYDTPLVRAYLHQKGVQANIPSRSKKKQRGRPRIFDSTSFKKIRYTVERFFSWIKAFRRIDTRYDRLASTFMGFIHIACILIYMRRF